MVPAKTEPRVHSPVPGRASGIRFQLFGGGSHGHSTSRWLCGHRTRVELGSGESVFQSALGALKRWQQFQLGWVEAWPQNTPIQTDEVVAVLGKAIGSWWINACRIVYVIDQSESISRFGFAYGTLPGHVESGEERFLVEWDQTTNRVHYDILAFSRPNHFATRLGYPVVRRSQKRFGRESAKAMVRAVNTVLPVPEDSQSPS